MPHSWGQSEDTSQVWTLNQDSCHNNFQGAVKNTGCSRSMWWSRSSLGWMHKLSNLLKNVKDWIGINSYSLSTKLYKPDSSIHILRVQLIKFNKFETILHGNFRIQLQKYTNCSSAIIRHMKSNWRWEKAFYPQHIPASPNQGIQSNSSKMPNWYLSKSNAQIIHLLVNVQCLKKSPGVSNYYLCSFTLLRSYNWRQATLLLDYSRIDQRI